MSKIRKVTAVLLSVIMLVCCFTVNAGAEETRYLKSGKKTVVTLKPGESAAYEFSVAEESDFSIDILMVQASWGLMNIYDDATGDAVNPEGWEHKNGEGGWDPNIKAMRLFWDSDPQGMFNYEGSVRYHLFSGRYHLEIKVPKAKEFLPDNEYKQWVKEGSTDFEWSGKITFTANYKSGDAEIDGFEITVKKGATIQLGALVSGGNGEKTTWSSSGKKIASVNSKGKVTAKKAGTAVITAKVGNSTATITIKVTK